MSLSVFSNLVSCILGFYYQCKLTLSSKCNWKLKLLCSVQVPIRASGCAACVTATASEPAPPLGSPRTPEGRMAEGPPFPRCSPAWRRRRPSSWLTAPRAAVGLIRNWFFSNLFLESWNLYGCNVGKILYWIKENKLTSSGDADWALHCNQRP